MSAIISAFSASTSTLMEAVKEKMGFPDIKKLMVAVKDTRGDINQIRMLLKGNSGTCLKLFKEAVAEGDTITQIQLSHALFGMRWGKDQERDFSSLAVGDLEKFSYTPREFVLFKAAYDEAMGEESDWEQRQNKDIETYRIAANHGYLSAFLELMGNEWRGHSSYSYGFAVQLRPFVGKGERQLDYHFGMALKSGCETGSPLYYEGLYWMHQSCGIPVKFPRERESFDDFFHRYVRQEDVFHTYYDHDGFWHVGPEVVLAPSREKWEAFLKEKLGNVKIAPLDSYVFKYDPEQIKTLLNEHKIGACITGSFVEHDDGKETVDRSGISIRGFPIHTLSMYSNHKDIGDISVRRDTFKMYKTIDDPKIKPIIEFIENVMTRSGSASSAASWLRQMGGSYI
jgi:hypothetical protein